MLDVFFISMGEQDAEENFTRLQEFVPNAKRITNVIGIYNVHKACAELSATENFWVVDADAWIVDGFNFDWEPDESAVHWGVPESECVIIWPSINPVNYLQYGYGAVKVFPRKPFIENRPWHIDMTSSIANVVINKGIVSCETRFNSTPESAWIGAFRECAKLASLSMIKTRINKAKAAEKAELEELVKYSLAQDWDDDKKQNYRKSRALLVKDRYKSEKDIFTYWVEMEMYGQNKLIWCTKGWDNKNGKYAILGAQAGSKFGLVNGDNLEVLDLINDWNWLRKEFKNVNV
jgi:hypothetical protein